MKVIHFLALLSLSALLCACAAIKGGTDVDDGRNALLAGNYKAAVGYFKEAEETDPSFMYGTELREGVASYLGRSQYLTGGLRSSPSDFRKSAFPAQERQPRPALPRPYVVSSRRPKGGADEYRTGYERN